MSRRTVRVSISSGGVCLPGRWGYLQGDHRNVRLVTIVLRRPPVLPDTGQCITFDQLEKYPRSRIIGELRYTADEGKKVTALAIHKTSLKA